MSHPPFILNFWILTKESSGISVNNPVSRSQDFKTVSINCSKPTMPSKKCKSNSQRCNHNSKKPPYKPINSWPNSLWIKPKLSKCKKSYLLKKKLPISKKPKLRNLLQKPKRQSLKRTKVCKSLWQK